MDDSAGYVIAVELISAAHELGDLELREKCRRYAVHASMLAEICSVVPEGIRSNEKKLKWYADGLIKVAVMFQELGHPELLKKLRGPEPKKVEDAIRRYYRALELSNSGHHQESIEICDSLLQELAASKEPLVDRCYPRISGLSGINYFRQNRLDLAIHFTTEAKRYCDRIGDLEGQRAYKQNLEVIAKSVN